MSHNQPQSALAQSKAKFTWKGADDSKNAKILSITPPKDKHPIEGAAFEP